MRLPVHRWFKYSAGFSAEWVQQTIQERCVASETTVLDPFAGSGTTLLVADSCGVSSIGIEAHPFVATIAATKLLWFTPVDNLRDKIQSIHHVANNLQHEPLQYPSLIYNCFGDESLHKLDKLRRAWLAENDDSAVSQLAWLALTSILRPSSSAGTAQWQYILPNKTKKVVADPFDAFTLQGELMRFDMREFQREVKVSKAKLIRGDARECPEVEDHSVGLVVTSPPYANNYDYADAMRFEMSFWGAVASWGGLHEAARRYLIRSSSQHASIEKLQLEELLANSHLDPIRPAITSVCHALAEERQHHGGKKHYHTMIAAYFVDLARVWHELHRVCTPNATACFVIGDSAPYGVYVPVDEWLGELALAAGFRSYRFEKLRDRNIKWKNRKHRVPLHEGRLWVET
ncbi:MAG: DNA modification methylase [Anaerolineales bacterium]|nr:DNA modification methylase [Anaerolineales bacterium]